MLPSGHELNLSQTFGSRLPLSYVFWESSDIPSELDDPLDADFYHRTSGSIHGELADRTNLQAWQHISLHEYQEGRKGDISWVNYQLILLLQGWEGGIPCFDF